MLVSAYICLWDGESTLLNLFAYPLVNTQNVLLYLRRGVIQNNITPNQNRSIRQNYVHVGGWLG